MTPCTKNKKLLSLLAIDALDSREAQVLRAHVETCPGCRSYLEDMSNVAGKLTASSAAAPEIKASDTFHRRLTRRIESEGQPGIMARMCAFTRSGGLDWRTVALVAGVVLGVLTVMLALEPQRGRRTVPSAVGPIVSTARPVEDLVPTFGSYRMLANRSLDALDQELTKEGKVGSAGAPTYTASSLTRAIAAD